MKLKPWHDVVKPREDLREGKSLDAAEFAVHLDRVRDGTGRKDYTDPEQFFGKTFLSVNLLDLASQVVRRMSGETSHTSSVFNLATNFGGGKTHALTLLYHLAKHGTDSHKWAGIGQIRSKAQVPSIPSGEVAVFVGTEFDSLAGRGDPGERRRTTPWGEIAWQLGGTDGFNLVKTHDEQRIAPGGDVIRKLLPEGKPCLILMDELMNYMSRFRREGLSHQLYNFLQNLSGALNERSVLVVSVPASIDLEMTVEDQADYSRITKMLDRVGKALRMTAGSETSEIVRRRLFEWDTRAVGSDGRVILSAEAKEVCREYARWVQDHSQLLGSFPADQARDAFEACYPFHPTVLSVFERKWQAVPKFQQTRGVLRLLAMWISNAYTNAYRKAHADPLLNLGTAPLDDPMFRAAVFEQLGDRALEAATTTDIAGRNDSHALVLDSEATEAIKKDRLHRKISTVVFFESNGGAAKGEATIPEIRLATGHPDLDLGNIETALEALVDKSYYLVVEKQHYKFSLKENLNKRFADKLATVKGVDETLHQEIQKVFAPKEGTERVFFPNESQAIPDRPVITFAIGGLEQTMEDAGTLTHIETKFRDHGTSARTFKSALIWVAAENPHAMREEARKLLAWTAIADEESDLHLNEGQKAKLAENVKKAEGYVRDAIWRSYRQVRLMGKDGTLQLVDLGLVHSSSAKTPLDNILNRLTTDGHFDSGLSVRKLVQNWSGAFTEWPTKAVRDALYASPLFPRIIKGTTAIQETIARGVTEGELAYVGKTDSGSYDPFVFRKPMSSADVEISDEVFIIRKATAEAYQASLTKPQPQPAPVAGRIVEGGPGTESETPQAPTSPGVSNGTTDPSEDSQLFSTPSSAVPHLHWNGEVPSQKWMNFYTKVISKFATSPGLTLRVSVTASPEGGVSPQKLEEVRTALRELGLSEEIGQ